jgi:amino-acid N-acetyltransferase
MKRVTTLGSLTVRKAVGSDKSAIRQLLEMVRLPTESLDEGTTTFYVAEKDGTFIGVAGFEFYGNDALLRSVAVLPEFQGKRIGDRIVDLMISTARQLRLKRIVLLTETAEAFFAKKRFRVVDRTSIDNERMQQSSEFTFACPSTAICMVLELVSPTI